MNNIAQQHLRGVKEYLRAFGSSDKSFSERLWTNSVSIVFQFGTAPKTLVSKSSSFKLDKEKLSKVYILSSEHSSYRILSKFLIFVWVKNVYGEFDLHYLWKSIPYSLRCLMNILIYLIGNIMLWSEQNSDWNVYTVLVNFLAFCAIFSQLLLCLL